MKLLPTAQLPLFETIEIETQNVCTRTCWFCKWGQLREEEPLTRMSWEMIEKILHDLAQLKFSGRLSWYGTNEALSDKRIFDILKLSRERVPTAKLVLTSNGDLVSQEVYDRLIASGLDRLGISIYDQRTYDRVIKIKGDKLTLMNMMDPRFEERMIVNRAGNIEVKKHAPQLEQVKQLKYYKENCQRPSSGMWVRPNGDVALCCEDTYGDVVFDNVMNASLEDIWFNNSKLNDYRNKLAASGRKGLPLCENCSHKGGKNSKDWLDTDHPLRIR